MAQEPPVSGGPESIVLHAAAAALGGRGLLILGASGSGKSGLAMRLVGLGWSLVADDRVVVERRGGALVARAPARLAGLVEARGIGILRVPALPEVPLTLAVDLGEVPAARMPHHGTITYLGIPIELISGREVPNLDVALTILLQNGRAVRE